MDHLHVCAGPQPQKLLRGYEAVELNVPAGRGAWSGYKVILLSGGLLATTIGAGNGRAGAADFAAWEDS